MASDIRYRFANDSNGVLTDVSKLDRETVDQLGMRFTSLDYGQDLVARLGTKRRKHFAHKPGTEVQGSRETYLHALGKRFFRKMYQRCLDEQLPYYIVYEEKRTCNRLEADYGLSCKLKPERKRFDITKKFTELKEEVRDGRFIPDLSLFAPANGEKIYIEIAVTHDSSSEKIASGIRIIEFKLFDEDDVDLIASSQNGLDGTHARVYNFRENKKTGNYCGAACSQTYFVLFYVNQTGKCFIEYGTEALLAQPLAGMEGYAVYHVYEPLVKARKRMARYFGTPSAGELFRYFIADAVKKNVGVRNCFLCKFHDINKRWNDGDIYRKTIFCRCFSKTCSSNEAAACSAFGVHHVHVENYLR